MSTRGSAYSTLTQFRSLNRLSRWKGLRPANVRVGSEWPVPDSQRPLQRFLEFPSFYRCFIRNYSQTAAPLTALTSTRVLFRWSEQALGAFTKLKSCFTTAPVLSVPDHDLQFIVDVDTKSLNSRQARWAHFFGLFGFTLLYRPGSKNIKPDAVSHLFACPGDEVLPSTILPQGVVVAAVSWGVERWVREAL